MCRVVAYIRNRLYKPNRYAKIPDVAKAFEVRTNNLYYMMRQLGIKI